MHSRTVKLREEHSGADSRYLHAGLTQEGDLHIEGQDLGPTVEKYFGAGNTEYEWAIVVKAADFPQLYSALVGEETDDVVSLLASRFAKDPRVATKEFLDEWKIPNEFWNRVGS